MLISEIAVSLVPVFMFLAALVVLDSYKLVRLRWVMQSISVGCLAALLCLLANSWLMELAKLPVPVYSRYLAPLIEETIKSLFMVYLIREHRVGFLVDAAILGFAIGAGFAFVENAYYLKAIHDHNLLLWTVRGFGTAAMHGATIAAFGIISKGLTDRKNTRSWNVYIPGLLITITIHSLFNHFILPPVITTLLMMVLMPVLIIVAFERSERATREWLGVGMNADIDLLETIDSGMFSHSHAGQYLESLRNRFSAVVVADMFCMLKIYLELALAAKGALLLREAGVSFSPDPDIKAKFAELRYLERNIGKTGKLALDPLLRTSSRDLWQIHMLEK